MEADGAAGGPLVPLDRSCHSTGVGEWQRSLWRGTQQRLPVNPHPWLEDVRPSGRTPL